MNSHQNTTATLVQQASTVAFMNRVYLWMVSGLLITALTAYFTSLYLPVLIIYLSYKPHGLSLLSTTFYCLLALQFIEVLGLSFLLNKISAFVATCAYLLYAFTVGLTFSVIFLAYSKENISSAFFITSFAFAGLSLFGYYTKKDLQFLGTFCLMGLFGLIGFGIYSLISPNALSEASQWSLNIAGIIIFSGLTAFDTQRIKKLAYSNLGDKEQVEKAAIFGALALYLDYINLFLKILGRRR